MGATPQDVGEEAPRGCHARGEELRVRKRRGGPRRAEGWESGPQNASSSPGGWGNPSVRPPRPPALPSLSFPCPGGAGIARGAWGETRQVRSPPSQRRRLGPSSPQLRAGLPLGPPDRRPRRDPGVRPKWPGGLRRSASFHFPSWAVDLWVTSPFVRPIVSPAKRRSSPPTCASHLTSSVVASP